MFLDTSGLLCFLDGREAEHGSAAVLFSAAPFRLTHTFVIAELVALAESRGLRRRPVLDLIAELDEDEEAEVVFVNERLYAAGLELLRGRPDKAWSLCDAISFLLMDERGVSEALTTDRHFEQAGFVRLLAP